MAFNNVMTRNDVETLLILIFKRDELPPRDLRHGNGTCFEFKV